MAAAEATRGELAWLDGRYLSRGDLAVPVGDAGFVLGATVTEQLRTFRGRLFLPDDHARRLGESLAVVGIRLPWSLDDVFTAAAHVTAHNHRLASAASADEDGPDLGLVIFVTPGDLAAQHGGHGGSPRVAIHTFPLAFGMWADAYERGIALRSVAVHQVPEACWPLRAKVRSRLHYFLADREAHATEPGARAVLTHMDGRISETSTANIAIVVDGRIDTPPVSDALGGVSLACARRLAATLGIAWQERTLAAADLVAADEILLTSTPNCILPATRFDGRPVGTGGPGPVFRAILDAWSRLVMLDIAAQSRREAGRTMAAASTKSFP
ncbi:MAG: aminotransferase class IV [Planctomycetia bacterium]|nr:aminotransferase class IV [Planctomycetia bacterium]